MKNDIVRIENKIKKAYDCGNEYLDEILFGMIENFVRDSEILLALYLELAYKIRGIPSTKMIFQEVYDYNEAIIFSNVESSILRKNNVFDTFSINDKEMAYYGKIIKEKTNELISDIFSFKMPFIMDQIRSVLDSANMCYIEDSETSYWIYNGYDCGETYAIVKNSSQIMILKSIHLSKFPNIIKSVDVGEILDTTFERKVF